MTWSEATGDLFNPEGWKDVTVPCENAVDCIGHGVNTKGVMGSGIAVEFKKRYPEMFEVYKIACDNEWLIPGSFLPWHEPNDLVIFNLASQEYPGANAKMKFIFNSLVYARQYMYQENLWHLALPRIGAGIGGLKWDEVKQTIAAVFLDTQQHVTLVSLEDA